MKKPCILFCICIIFLSCSTRLANPNGTLSESTNKTESALFTESNDAPPIIRVDSLVTLPNGLILEKRGSKFCLEDDILFSEEQLDYLSSLVVGDSIPPRSGSMSQPLYYWPARTVPYTFGSTVTSANRNTAIQAMNTISSCTGVKFVAANSSHPNMIKICNSSYNRADYGMQGGIQEVEIYNYDKGIIMHEILHALGFYHEQSRSDRDSYVNILWDNILAGKEHNFYKYNASLNTGALDYGSIMMYGPTYFSKNPSTLFTIVRKDGLPYSEQRDSLSTSDINGIKRIYGPPYHKLSTSSQIVQEISEPTYEYYREYCSAWISIYSDEAFTTSSSLSYSRPIRLKKTQTYLSNGQYITNNTYETITLPAGTSSYLVASWENVVEDNFGTTTEYFFTSYQIVNSH